MTWKENGPGGCCCSCCQEGWNLLLARFSQIDITGPTLPSVNFTLPTSFAGAACGTGSVSRECEALGDDKLLSGASLCSPPFYVGFARRRTQVNSSGCNFVFAEANCILAVSCDGTDYKFIAEYYLVDRAAGSGKDCGIPGCPTGDFYLPDPLLAGLTFGAGGALVDNHTPLPTAVGSDETYSEVFAMRTDDGVCGANAAAVFTDKLIDYYYRQKRIIITDDASVIPASVTLSPLVNPGGATATFDFT